MKKRWILVIILLVGLFVYLEHNESIEAPCVTNSAGRLVSIQEIHNIYNSYNITEFGGKLPQDVMIDFDEKDPENMGTTSRTNDGRYRISFNPAYVTGLRTTTLSTLHEMCHISAGIEENHGPNWQVCMLKLDADDVWREIILDGFQGQVKGSL